MDTPSIESSVVCDIDEDETCGCHVACKGKHKTYPVGFLQRFAKPYWALVLFSCVGFLQGFIISGLINVVLTTIQKRFELSSADAGLILSSYNIASSVVIPIVSYIGGRGIKPIWIGLGMGLMGLGCFTFSLPHFLSPPYEVKFDSAASEYFCTFNSSIQEPETVSLNYFKYVFVFAHALNGIGTSALITLGMAYLDENVEQELSSLYHGIYYAIAAAFGPAAGYVIGGFTIQLFTEIGTNPGITSADSSWVGAWWLLFLVCGFILLFLSASILMFPRHMPGTKALHLNRSSEMHQDGLAKISEKDEEFGKKLKDLPTSILILFRNPAFMLVALANALDFGLISGFSAFTPKYLESMFGLTPSAAAYYLGIVVILGGALGYISGGLIVSKAKLTVNGMIRLCCLSTVIALACSCIYLYSCPNIDFAGTTVKYLGESDNSGFSSTNFNASCNSRCNCPANIYKPICGDDGITYFSPCFAGCTELVNETYTNCSCIQSSSQDSTAKPGMCVNSNCNNLIGFMFAIFGILFFTVFCWTPVLQIVIRVVPFKQRSFALGTQWVFNRCFGGIPGPILFGKVYDMACAVWSGSLDGQGSCRLYFNHEMAHNTLYLVLGHKAITLFFYIVGAILYHPSDESKQSKRKIQFISSSHKSSNITIPNQVQHDVVNQNNKTTRNNFNIPANQQLQQKEKCKSSFGEIQNDKSFISTDKILNKHP